MKIINCNNWAPRNKQVPYNWGAVPIPITNPLIANHIGLYDNFNLRGVAWAYYNLLWFIRNYHYFYEKD